MSSGTILYPTLFIKQIKKDEDGNELKVKKDVYGVVTHYHANVKEVVQTYVNLLIDTDEWVFHMFTPPNQTISLLGGDKSAAGSVAIATILNQQNQDATDNLPYDFFEAS